MRAEIQAAGSILQPSSCKPPPPALRKVARKVCSRIEAVDPRNKNWCLERSLNPAKSSGDGCSRCHKQAFAARSTSQRRAEDEIEPDLPGQVERKAVRDNAVWLAPTLG